MAKPSIRTKPSSPSSVSIKYTAANQSEAFLGIAFRSNVF